MGREKLYYRIGEVSKLLGVPPHVLRYWEREFPQLRPRRMANHRLYRQKDIQILRWIKELIHQRGFTIKGAREELKRLVAVADGEKLLCRPQGEAVELIKQIRRELEDIYSLLR